MDPVDTQTTAPQPDSAADSAPDGTGGDTIPLSRFRALLASPRGRRKLDALLSAEDPAEAVALLPVTELYQLIGETGLGEAGDLLSLATPEQVRGCLDLAVWDQDQLQMAALVPWLQVLIDTGYENLGQVWARLDPELTALVLQRLVKVHDLTQDEAPSEDTENPLLATPDSFFVIELVSGDEESNLLVTRLIEDLYRADPGGALARHTIMAARSEPPAELEEMSYRWRAGRLADLGYVDFHDALEIFRALDPESVTIGEGSEDRFTTPGDADDAATAAGAMPALVAEGVVGRSFLARALDRIDDADELARLELALVVLVNKVLSAARVPPGDDAALAVAAEHASATVSLGLESVSKGDLDRAAAALRSVSLTRLHRAGHTLTLRLARMALALAPRALTAGEPDASVLAALAGKRPWFPRVLDAAGDQTGTGIRAFESLEDVRRVAEALTRLALRVAVASSLGVDLAAMAAQPEPRPELDDHVRTALVRTLAGGPFEAAPLSADELAACRQVALDDTALAGNALTPEARERAASQLLARLDRAQVTAGRHLLPGLLDAWLADITDQLGRLPANERPDPRFLGGLVLATDRD